jgi:hypothetical protein
MSVGPEPGNRLLWSKSFTGDRDKRLQFSVKRASDVLVANCTDDGSGCDVSPRSDRGVGLEDSGGRTDDRSFERLERSVTERFSRICRVARTRPRSD